jgi:hypothetical protein
MKRCDVRLVLKEGKLHYPVSRLSQKFKLTDFAPLEIF